MRVFGGTFPLARGGLRVLRVFAYLYRGKK